MSKIMEQLLGVKCNMLTNSDLDAEVEATGVFVGVVRWQDEDWALVLQKDNRLVRWSLGAVQLVEAEHAPANETPEVDVAGFLHAKPNPEPDNQDLVLLKIKSASPIDWYKDHIGAMYWAESEGTSGEWQIHRSEREVAGKWVEFHDAEVIWRPVV